MVSYGDNVQNNSNKTQWSHSADWKIVCAHIKSFVPSRFTVYCQIREEAAPHLNFQI